MAVEEATETGLKAVAGNSPWQHQWEKLKKTEVQWAIRNPTNEDGSDRGSGVVATNNKYQQVGRNMGERQTKTINRSRSRWLLWPVSVGLQRRLHLEWKQKGEGEERTISKSRKINKNSGDGSESEEVNLKWLPPCWYGIEKAFCCLTIFFIDLYFSIGFITICWFVT